MKAKVITYSTSVLNKVVRRSMELTELNASVFYAICNKNPQDEDWDDLSLVLRVGEIFYVHTNLFRKTLNAEVIAAATDFAAHYPQRIEQLMQRGEFLQLLHIEVSSACGMDVAPLMAYREQRQRLEQQLREQREEQNVPNYGGGRRYLPNGGV